MAAFDMREMNKFLNQFLPMIVQQQMERDRMRMWLKKSLEEYKAWGEEQKLVQERGAGIEKKQTVLQAAKEYFAGRPHDFAQFVDIVNRLYPEEPVLESYLPADLPGLVRGTEEATTSALMAEQAREPITQEVLANLVTGLGPDFSAERVGSVLRERREEEERALTGRRLTLEEAELPVRKEELGVRREELEIEKKGEKTKKEIEKDLKTLMDKRDAQVQKYYGIGAPLGKYRDPQVRIIEENINKIDRQIKEIEKKLDKKVLPTDEDYKRFEQMAKKNKEVGLKINWEAAIMQGFSIAWLNKLKKELGL